jgi:lipoate-protein ligase A
MALDEVLLESALRDGIATLRFYRWSEPTLSLGYFQRLADRNSHTRSRACPIVRRTTGGGAIVHDQELTYSLAIPASSPLARHSEVLYRLAHESLIDALASWGIHSKKIGASDDGHCEKKNKDKKPGEESFLCFERLGCGDVAIDRFKVCGSAQRRSHGAILQHGSVLLGTSTAATELPGIRELADVTVHENELIAAWRPRLSQRLNLRTLAADWTPEELQSARSLTTSRYANPDWTGKR